MEYLRYWSLTEPPFGPNASRCFFSASPQRETTAWIQDLVLRRQPLGVLVCESGIGVTRLMAQVAMSNGFDQYPVEVIGTNGRQSSVERTFANLAKGLGLSGQRLSLRAITRALDSNHRNQIHTLWLIDGAGKHSIDAMLQLTKQQHDLSIVATVTPSLRKLVLKGLNEHLGRRKARTVPQFEMRPFDVGETRQFVDHSLQVAGARRNIFTDGAKESLHEQATGKIRHVTHLAQQALMLGASERVKLITACHVRSLQNASDKAA